MPEIPNPARLAVEATSDQLWATLAANIGTLRAIADGAPAAPLLVQGMAAALVGEIFMRECRAADDAAARQAMPEPSDPLAPLRAICDRARPYRAEFADIGLYGVGRLTNPHAVSLAAATLVAVLDAWDAAWGPGGGG